VLRLPAELTHGQARACLAELARAIGQEDGTVVVDAAALQRFDSSALAVLLELRRICLSQGKQLDVQGWPRHLADLATLYGIDGLLRTV